MENTTCIRSLLIYNKKLNFRWFQLWNSSDGRRGTIMNSKRNVEQLGDPEIPEEENGEVFNKPTRLHKFPTPIDEEAEDNAE